MSFFPKLGWLTSESIHNLISDQISRNGVNNRLEKLRSYGFLDRTRHGKWWLYSRSK